jgi:ubiquinol-cytochrome c reductase cytochrome c1 subunit
MMGNFAKLLLAFMFSLPLATQAADDIKEPRKIVWSFDGMTGKFDRQAIQRGFKVYREVCSACHSLKLKAFRSLADLGYSEEQIKTIAASYNIVDGPNADGEMFERPGRPSDHFPPPYANDNAARSANNNGALPPDLSLIIKARHDGANYLYSLLTGYSEPPKDFKLGENMHYNPYFAGGGKQFSMIPPLVKEGQVTYDDGTKATVDQMARDVVSFLQWAAEPEMEKRKAMGMRSLVFVLGMTILFYLAKVRIWRRVQ